MPIAPPSKLTIVLYVTRRQESLLTRELRTTGACFINMTPSSSLLDQINSYLETRQTAILFVKDITTELPQLEDLKVNDTPDFAKTFLDIGGPHVLDKKTNIQQNNQKHASPPS
jgi:hypothetical protein